MQVSSVNPILLTSRPVPSWVTVPRPSARDVDASSHGTLRAHLSSMYDYVPSLTRLPLRSVRCPPFCLAQGWQFTLPHRFHIYVSAFHNVEGLALLLAFWLLSVMATHYRVSLQYLASQTTMIPCDALSAEPDRIINPCRHLFRCCGLCEDEE